MSTVTSLPSTATFFTALPVTKSRPVFGSINALRRPWTSASAIGMTVHSSRSVRIDGFALIAARSSPMPRARRTLFVTTALPYANGPFHIGHVMEYIQADIWVRFQRMRGAEVHFVCADDAHGAPIMLKAEKEGIPPEQLIERVGRLHVDDWK